MEQQINAVLAYHQEEINNIKFLDSKEVDARIAESEKLLLSLGIEPKKVESLSHNTFKPVMTVPHGMNYVKKLKCMWATI